MTSDQPSSQTPGLAPGKVTYLSLEGGGGKGSAYLGALAVLAEPEVRVLTERNGDFRLNPEKISGVSGSSAGAITAALLASGWGLRELYEYVLTDRKALENFFDRPVWGERTIPVARQNLPQPTPSQESGMTFSCIVEDVRNPDEALWGPSKAWMTVLNAIRRDLLVHSGRVLSRSGRQSFKQSEPEMLTALLNHYGPKIIRQLVEWIDPKALETAKVPLERALANLSATALNVKQDFGAFSGAFARRFLGTAFIFGEYISLSTGVNLSRREELQLFRQTVRNQSQLRFASQIGMTFDQFQAQTASTVGKEIDLVLTGTNLQTGESRYFSSRHGTPEFRVADAIRISMGLPLIFKPIHIDNTDFGGRYEGYWVDGGVLNNNPIHAFDDSEGRLADGVLGLRLGIDRPGDINGLGDYIKSIPAVLLNAGESREIRTPRERGQTVMLPTGALQTVNFTPKQSDLEDALLRSAKAMIEYFGLKKKDPREILLKTLGLSFED